MEDFKCGACDSKEYVSYCTPCKEKEDESKNHQLTEAREIIKDLMDVFQVARDASETEYPFLQSSEEWRAKVFLDKKV